MNDRNTANFNALLSELAAAKVAIDDVAIALAGWELTEEQSECIYDMCRDIRSSRHTLLERTDQRYWRWAERNARWEERQP